MRSKVFRERVNDTIVDNLILQMDKDKLVVRVTCDRGGALNFTKAQARAIANYLLKISR